MNTKREKRRYHVSLYDSDMNEVHYTTNNYLRGLYYFQEAVKLSLISDIQRVYMFDMQHPGSSLFIVAKYDNDFH